jgi:hypothetical protein
LGGLIARCDHPELLGSIAWLVRRGDLVSVLPGVYCRPDLVTVPEVKMRAVCLRHRYTAPALTAIDVATFDCADAIDIALRTRATTTLDRMSEALMLTAYRRGTAERLRLLIDSRNEPWSAAARRSHRFLRGAGITAGEATGRSWWRIVVLHRHRLPAAQAGSGD